MIRRGDLFRHELAGGGGWGDPLDRDPASVLADVRNELVSTAHAHDAYGVILRPVPLLARSGLVRFAPEMGAV